MVKPEPPEIVDVENAATEKEKEIVADLVRNHWHYVYKYNYKDESDLLGIARSIAIRELFGVKPAIDGCCIIARMAMLGIDASALRPYSIYPNEMAFETTNELANKIKIRGYFTIYIRYVVKPSKITDPILYRISKTYIKIVEKLVILANEDKMDTEDAAKLVELQRKLRELAKSYIKVSKVVEQVLDVLNEVEEVIGDDTEG